MVPGCRLNWTVESGSEVYREPVQVQRVSLTEARVCVCMCVSHLGSQYVNLMSMLCWLVKVCALRRVCERGRGWQVSSRQETEDGEMHTFARP